MAVVQLDRPERDWEWHLAQAEVALRSAAMQALPADRIQAHTARARAHIMLAQELRVGEALREFERRHEEREHAAGVVH